MLAIRAAGPEVVYAGGVGLYEIDARRLTYRPVPNALVMKQVINALLVEGNTVWAATYNGLVRYDRTTHEAKMYAHAVNDAGSLADNYVRDMLRDSRGRLWVTTRLGLDRLDEATGRFIHIRHDAKVADSLPSDNVQPIAEDRQGRLWIGTIGDGLTVLWKWTPDGKPHFRTLRRADGFPSDIVLTVMRGADGRMWSNTPGGLAVVDPKTLRFHTYTAADGLRTSSQNLFGSATLRDGTIVFPGDEGLIVVRPELLHTTRPAPRLVATEIRVPGSAQSAEALAWDSLTQGIVLPAGEKDFQAGFALVDTTAPDAVRYRYKLEGFDEEWLDTPSWSRTAAYTNLPAGRYRLLIQSEGRPGADTSAQLEIPVVVMAAWYESSWFFLLKVAGILVLLLVAVRLRTAVIRRRQKELERDVKARTTELATKQAELLEANQRLAELATRDALTGAYNRRQFLEIAPGEIERARHTGGGCTLLLIDADHFKAINDRYGHMAGDAVLRELVARLAAQLRKDDVIARYGGEELVVLLPHTRLTDGLHLAERLRAGIAAAPMVWLDHAIRVTISIGAVEAEGSESLDELLRRADGALYEAKDAGRDRVLAAPPGENQPR